MSASQHSSPPPKRRYTFPKSRRLLYRREFLRVQNKGKRIHCGPLLVCVLPAERDVGRVGITTSKKVGRAVFRNRLRRLIRDALRRLLLPEELPFDVVLIAKKGLPLTLDQEAIDRAIALLVRKLTQAQKATHPQSHPSAPKTSEKEGKE